MSDVLFHPGDLGASLEAARKKITEEIERLSEDYVLKVNEAEYVKHKVAEESVRPLVIESGAEVVRHYEVERTQQGHFSTYIERVPTVEVSLRFSGDRGLFKMRQNYFGHVVEGIISGDEVRADFSIPQGESPESTRNKISRWEQRIRQHIADQKPQLDAWNIQLEDLVRRSFQATKERYLKKHDLVAAIGLPIRKRNNEPGTYSVGLPPKRLTISSAPPTIPAGQFSPHPALDEKSYQDILDPIRWMGKTMERDPTAYTKLHEENLRSQFLALLNGSFEGKGSGETFSVEGKTDIFLRANDRAVFIAECKFWDGPAGFGRIVDQVTSYLTWRDSKTAILLFVQNLDISSVLSQIPDLLQAHRLFTQLQSSNHQGEFRVMLRNAKDESLPLTLTVLCFHLPETAQRRGKKSG